MRIFLLIHFCNTLQLDQEIDLILGKKGVIASTFKDWSNKWVLAIVKFSGTLARKKATIVSKIHKAYEG